MVVLNTYDTIIGKIMVKGILNFPWILIIVGVPYVVVLQWKVDDSFTYHLMKGFCEELRNGKDASSSLCVNMFQMFKDKRKVHEWAPLLFMVCL
jgi:CHAT domain-containing protein